MNQINSREKTAQRTNSLQWRVIPPSAKWKKLVLEFSNSKMMKGRVESLQSIPRLMHKEINYSTLSSLSLNDYALINQFRLLEGYINNTTYCLYIVVMTITFYHSCCNTNTIGVIYGNG